MNDVDGVYVDGVYVGNDLVGLAVMGTCAHSCRALAGVVANHVFVSLLSLLSGGPCG